MLLFITFRSARAASADVPGPAIVPPGWKNDLIYGILNGWLVSLGLIALIISMMVISPGLVPRPGDNAVTAQPYWLQTLQVLIIAA